MSSAFDSQAPPIDPAPHVRLVHHVLRTQFCGVSACYEELYSEGLVGLVKAAMTFDPRRKTAWGVYAFACIRNEILMYLRRERKEPVALSLDAPAPGGDGEDESRPLHEVIGFDRSVEDEAEAHAWMDKLLAWVQRRNSRAWEWCRLWLFGYSWVEIAQREGYSPAFVRYRVLRLIREYVAQAGAPDVSKGVDTVVMELSRPPRFVIREPEPGPVEVYWQCFACGLRFESKSELARHRRANHERKDDERMAARLPPIRWADRLRIPQGEVVRIGVSHVSLARSIWRRLGDPERIRIGRTEDGLLALAPGLGFRVRQRGAKVVSVSLHRAPERIGLPSGEYEVEQQVEGVLLLRRAVGTDL